MLERLDEHALDFLIGQAVDGFTSIDCSMDVPQLTRADAEDTVGVDLERASIRGARRHRRDAAQLDRARARQSATSSRSPWTT